MTGLNNIFSGNQRCDGFNVDRDVNNDINYLREEFKNASKKVQQAKNKILKSKEVNKPKMKEVKNKFKKKLKYTKEALKDQAKITSGNLKNGANKAKMKKVESAFKSIKNATKGYTNNRNSENMKSDTDGDRDAEAAETEPAATERVELDDVQAAREIGMQAAAALPLFALAKLQEVQKQADREYAERQARNTEAAAAKKPYPFKTKNRMPMQMPRRTVRRG
jgi:hypothetical protein